MKLNGLSFCEKVRLSRGQKGKGTILKFSVEPMAPSGFYNGYNYLDTMNPEATRKFIELTHEKYKSSVQDKFGREIKGIFTDEPHRGAVMCGFALSNDAPEYLTPYTSELFHAFSDEYGYDLRDCLPELFLRRNGEKMSQVKWHYMKLLQKLFIHNFLAPVNAWCKQNRLILTGHLLHEDSLTAQTSMIGSVMAAYEHMEEPGMDVLGEFNRCFWIAKQLQSVGRQFEKNVC